MRKYLIYGCWCALVLGLLAARAASPAAPKEGAREARAALKDFLSANDAFLKGKGPGHFKAFAESQAPVATVISCSDSRVQMQALSADPDNRLFVIRNIGNQFATAEGSVEYGVHHLHTPLVLVVGHVRCGAIQAAMGDYSKESPAIRLELDTIKAAHDSDWLGNVKHNVDDQVKAVLAKFGPEVKSGELTVVGAVYDFANDMGQGNGRLVVTNVNGETSPDRIKALTGS